MSNLLELPDRPTGLAGNPDLLNALLTRWRPYVVTAARNRLRGGTVRLWNRVYDEDDIAQEVLILAARQARKYDPARGTFKHFLCLCLYDACGHLFRVLARQSHRPDLAFRGSGLNRRPDRRAGDPVAAAVENDLWDRAGRDLDAAEREVLRLRCREGWTKERAGAALGITASVCCHRTRAVKAKLAADGIG